MNPSRCLAAAAVACLLALGPARAQRAASPSLHGFAPPESMLDDGGALVDGEFTARRRALDEKRRTAQKLITTDLEAYVPAMRAYLAAAENLVARYPASSRTKDARESIGGYYLGLGHIVRFRLNRPREAVDLYEAAMRNGSGKAGLGIAETFQFDLRDPRRAVTEYRRLLAALPAMPSSDDPVSNSAPWARRWLEAQIRYLESGQTFSGKLTQDDSRVAGAIQGGMLGTPHEAFGIQSDLHKVLSTSKGGAIDGGDLDRKEIARLLDSLPTSAFALAANAAYLPLLPDADSILAFLRRQDPAGFATACYFMVLEISEVGEGRKPPSEAIREAKARFFADRPVDISWIQQAMEQHRRTLEEYQRKAK